MQKSNILNDIHSRSNTNYITNNYKNDFGRKFKQSFLLNPK